MVAWQGDAKPGRVHQRGEIEGVSLILGHGVRFLVLGRESWEENCNSCFFFAFFFAWTLLFAYFICNVDAQVVGFPRTWSEWVTGKKIKHMLLVASINVTFHCMFVQAKADPRCHCHVTRSFTLETQTWDAWPQAGKQDTFFPEPFPSLCGEAGEMKVRYICVLDIWLAQDNVELGNL
jgi:hypothetical protein